MKVTNLDLHNEVKGLKSMISELDKYLRGLEFKSFDSLQYIKVPLEELTPIWYFSGNYYTSARVLYDIVVREKGYDKKRDAFDSLLKNNKRQEEMWTLGINLAYTANHKNKHKITTLGHITNASHNILKISGNTARFMEDGKTHWTNLGGLVYNKFIDHDFKEESVRHLDGNMGNSRIDNVVPHGL